jgi:outer membrane protein OmpA-like peptidoglycan-associated protein
LAGPRAASTDDTVTAVAPPVPARPPRASGDVYLPSLTGPIGLFRASTADVGTLYQLRLGLHGEWFSSSNFLVEGDSNQRLQGGLAFGFTPHPNVEIFGALLNSNNRNRRMRQPNDRDPELIKSFGDLVLGPKGVWKISPAATVGFELGLRFMSSITGLSFSPSSTSFWLGPVFTYDFRRDLDVPVRLHANAGYYGDNSDNLHALAGTTDYTKEVAMFAYGMAASRLRSAFAGEWILTKVSPKVPVSVFGEYHLEYVTASADPSFQEYMVPNCGAPPRMPCVDNRDMQWLTFGMRVSAYKGLTADLGIDVRVRSAGFPYGPPLPPYNIVFGIAYPFDIGAFTKPVVVTRTVERKDAAGHVTGTVRSAHGGTPVAGAVVAVVDRPRARAATDGEGGFTTAPISPGPAELEVTAPSFEPAKITAQIVAGKPVELAISLTPKAPSGNVRGRVTDGGGNGVEASVKFAGAENFEAKADASGTFSASLPVGTYQVRAEAPGLPVREGEVNVLAGQDRELNLELRARTPNPDVVLAGNGIRLRRYVRFEGETATLQPASQKLLDGVADVLMDHSEIRKLKIEVHWDDSLPKPRALEVTELQATAIRSYLAGRGVPEARLEAVGVGSARPLVPNLGPAARLKNRRVELRVESQ